MAFIPLPHSDDEAVQRPYLNTGLPLDMANGKLIPKVDGGFAISGGMGPMTAVIADPNRYKSAGINGATVNCMARFPDSQFYALDTEYSTTDATRMANMSNLYLDDPQKREQHIGDLVGRISIYDQATTRGETLDAWFDYLREIKDFKTKHIKDYTVETEVIDPSTGDPYKMLLPTFASVDSWSAAQVRQLVTMNETFTDETASDKQRTMFMNEGWQKTRLMRLLPGLCVKGGIYLTMTGQLGKKTSMDGKPVKKELVYMNQDEMAKAMGPQFNYLMSTIIKNGKVETVVDPNDRNKPGYPSKYGMSAVELNDISCIVVRGKNAPAGPQFSLIASQTRGVLSGMSYYQNLKDAKYFGLGTANKVKSVMLPDLDLGRTKIYDLSLDYKVSRALELTYQLYFIQTYWSQRGQPVNFGITPEELMDKLNTSGIAIDDILNSRGWWTYKDAKPDREYLTLPDVLSIVEGTYKPKFLSVKA